MTTNQPGGTGTITESAGPGAAKPSAIDGLRRNSVAACVIVIIESALGNAVNLYVAVPAADRGNGVWQAIGHALTSGPVALIVHTAVGLLLIITAVSALVRSILVRRPAWMIAAAAGLLAIVSAASGGANFVESGTSAASLTMAISAAVAVLCYLVIAVTARPRPAA